MDAELAMTVIKWNRTAGTPRTCNDPRSERKRTTHTTIITSYTRITITITTTSQTKLPHRPSTRYVSLRILCHMPTCKLIPITTTMRTQAIITIIRLGRRQRQRCANLQLLY